MGTEKRAWEWLRDGLKDVPALDIQRVENTCKSGVPDVEGCIRGTQFWLELKAGPEPASACSQIKCEPFKKRQREFFVRRLNAGGNVWMLYRVLVACFLIRGRDALAIKGRPTLLWLKAHTQCKSLVRPRGILGIILKEGMQL
jgi:hypothetical protein